MFFGLWNTCALLSVVNVSARRSHWCTFSFFAFHLFLSVLLHTFLLSFERHFFQPFCLVSCLIFCNKSVSSDFLPFLSCVQWSSSVPTVICSPGDMQCLYMLALWLPHQLPQNKLAFPEPQQVECDTKSTLYVAKWYEGNYVVLCCSLLSVEKLCAWEGHAMISKVNARQK